MTVILDNTPFLYFPLFSALLIYFFKEKLTSFLASHH